MPLKSFKHDFNHTFVKHEKIELSNQFDVIFNKWMLANIEYLLFKLCENTALKQRQNFPCPKYKFYQLTLF